MKIEDIVKMYYELNEQAKTLEKQLKELRPSIETHVATSLTTEKLMEPTTLVIGDFVATLAPMSRENFNLKEAKVMLNTELLSPYISRSNYTTLKINRITK